MLISDDLIATLQKETIKERKNGYHSSLLHNFVASNVFKKPIMSIFPKVQNPAVNRQDHIVALDRVDAELLTKIKMIVTTCGLAQV